jgi:pimeloyl-ACP methyl ester carboxylesterase
MGPMSYRGMASETAGFLDELGIGRARMVGWSDGGSVAMHLALSRPDLVAKLVVIGALAGNEGAAGGMNDLVSGSEESRALPRTMFEPLYAALAPGGPGTLRWCSRSGSACGRKGRGSLSAT